MEGLNTILRVFQDSHSLVVLTDFRGTVFSNLSYPIILRKLRLAWLWLWSWKKNWHPHFLLEYAQDEILTREINFSDHHKLQYPLGHSPFWTPIEKEQYHSFLNISSYCLKTLSFNNIASIALFLHIHLFGDISASASIADYKIPHVRSHNIFPSPIARVKILVIYPSENQETDQLTEVIVALANSASDHSKYMSHAKIYLVNTSAQLDLNMTQTEANVVIQSLSIVQWCQIDSKMFVNFLPKNYDRGIMSDLRELSKVMPIDLCRSNPSVNNLLIFFAREEEANELNMGSYLSKKLQKCYKFESSFQEVNRVLDGYANILNFVLGNFSCMRNGLHVCDNGKLVYIGHKNVPRSRMLPIHIKITQSLIPAGVNTFMYPVVIPSVYNDLRFVTCGYRGYGQMRFSELLQAFDATVWCVSIILIPILATMLQNLSAFEKTISLTQSLYIPIKLLLEQGNPFPESLAINHRCKCITGTVLLMGIVLSNAYKNTNVYNLIIPRELVPYKYLKELITDHFSIYSRSQKFHGTIYLQWWLGMHNVTDSFHEAISVQHERRYLLNLTSNLRSGQIILLSEVEILRLETEQTGFPCFRNNLFELFYNNTSLLTLTPSFLKRAVSKAEEKVSWRFRVPKIDYSGVFFQLELNHLLSLLRNCNKTALVLPTCIGYNFTKQLEDEGIVGVHQGVEAFYEMNIVLTLKGMIPRYLVQRFKDAEGWGLWKRWEGLFRKRFIDKGDRRTKPLERPTMRGNVIVIFLLLFLGWILSSVCFGSELFGPLRYIPRIFQRTKNPEKVASLLNQDHSIEK